MKFKKIYYPTNKLYTKNFYIKKISIYAINNNYPSWLKQNNKFIVNSNFNEGIKNLNYYIKKKLNKYDTLFFSIHNKTNTHIGNIKFEPIIHSKFSTMGILIGDQNFQGKGYYKEIFIATFNYLKHNFNLKYIDLGVNIDNKYAIKAFKKFGFKFKKYLNNRKVMIMVYDL